MNLLITGGAGFIGSNLIRHLMDKPEITKLINLDCLTYAGHLENLVGIHGKHPRYIFEKVDLRNKTEVLRVVREHRVTHVVHLAAETHVDRSIRRPDDFITTNITGSFHLLEVCRQVWELADFFPHFLHVSTDEVYGSNSDTDNPFTESSPLNPSSPYAASKAASDCLVHSFIQTYEFPASITRCVNNYGPCQFPEKLIPLVIHSILARNPIPIYGDGLNIRDWLFVGDHCEALWTVLNGNKQGQIYNLSGDHPLTNLELVYQICDLLDQMKPGLGGNARSLISFVADRPGHDRCYSIDSAKIRKDYNWQPKMSLEKALHETVKWYLAALQ